MYIFLFKKIGKTKKNWSKCKHGSGACWLCFAFGKNLGKPKYIVRGNKKIKNPIFKVKDKTYMLSG